MLFSEIYGSYFNVVAAVLSEASAGCLTDRRMTELIQAKAFAESSLSIPAALKKEAWPLLDAGTENSDPALPYYASDVAAEALAQGVAAGSTHCSV